MSETPGDYWDFFAMDARRTGSELYGRLSENIGRDEEMKALAARVKKGQPKANPLLGAVHFLLLRGAEHPLKQFYPSVGGQISAKDEDPYPSFKDFVSRHRDEVTALVETRVTNTNEVGRSAILHPGFRVLAAEAGEPLGLVEIGPSAGLNLSWDRYGVRYERDGVPVAVVSADSGLVLDVELRGDRLPPVGPPPKVAERIGLELNPVDLTNNDDRDWLRALVWPEDVVRANRLAKAIALGRPGEVDIRAGDALALLPDALAEIPRSHVACVFHTIAIYQFSREMKEALENILIVAGLRRPVFRLAFEFDGTDYMLSLIRYADGVRDERVLARSHPHGTWLEWLA